MFLRDESFAKLALSFFLLQFTKRSLQVPPSYKTTKEWIFRRIRAHIKRRSPFNLHFETRTSTSSNFSKRGISLSRWWHVCETEISDNYRVSWRRCRSTQKLDHYGAVSLEFHLDLDTLLLRRPPCTSYFPRHSLPLMFHIKNITELRSVSTD